MSTFEERILNLCKALVLHKDDVAGNEQATKEHLIGPFFSELGWKRDPKTWRAEFDADFNGRKKGEKVDYAILQNGEPIVLIECKPYTAKEKALTARDGQLARYFAATSAQISVITNGMLYRFFSDLEKTNIQDVEPFFIFDCTSPSKAEISALEKFSLGKFDIKIIKEWANEHQFSSKVKAFLSNIVARPNEVIGFAHYLLEHTHTGPRQQKVVQRLNDQLPELMNEVLGEQIKLRFSNATQPQANIADENGIITTSEEKAAFTLIKAMLAGAGKNSEEIIYKDMKNWMNISHKSKSNWFVRLFFNEPEKGLLFRISAGEIGPFLPLGAVAVAKGKHSFVVIDPKDISGYAKAILVSFESRAAAKDVDGEEDEMINAAA